MVHYVQSPPPDGNCPPEYCCCCWCPPVDKGKRKLASCRRAAGQVPKEERTKTSGQRSSPGELNRELTLALLLLGVIIIVTNDLVDDLADESIHCVCISGVGRSVDAEVYGVWCVCA